MFLLHEFAYIDKNKLFVYQSESTNTMKNHQSLIDRNSTHHWIHHGLFSETQLRSAPKLRGASGRRIPLLEIPAVEGGDDFGAGEW